MKAEDHGLLVDPGSMILCHYQSLGSRVVYIELTFTQVGPKEPVRSWAVACHGLVEMPLAKYLAVFPRHRSEMLWN